MAKYKLQNGSSVIRTADGASIPADPRNSDYRDYLAWVALGNVADPADPVPTVTPAQLAQGLMADTSAPGTFARGLIALLAARFSLTPAQIITAIANAAS